MDRSVDSPGVDLDAADLEILDRAAVQADLPGLLRAYGWRAVRGQDAWNRRVLTNAEETRRIVVKRNPENGRWLWWDTAIEILGNIVDAVRQLIGFQLLRDIVGLLRDALNTPPGPLPVLEAREPSTPPGRINSFPITDQPPQDEEKRLERLGQLAQPDDEIDCLLPEDAVGIDDKSSTETTQGTDDEPAEPQNIGDEEDPELTPVKPPKRRRRGR